MNTPSNPALTHSLSLSAWEKIVALGSWAFAGVIFLTVGWFAIAPNDPLGPVRMTASGHPIAVLVQVMALAAVTSAVATAVAGRLLADVGTFATAVGLIVASLRGGTAETLFARRADAAVGFHHGLGWRFLLESVGWTAVMVVAVIVSALTARWLFSTSHMGADDPHNVRAAAARALAGRDIPRLPRSARRPTTLRQTPPMDGIKHMGLTAALVVAALGVLTAGWHMRSIQHGQACFVIAAGVGIASYFAHRIVLVRSALWSMLGVAIAAIIAYAWASIQPTEDALPVVVSTSAFLRVLPVQFIAVGSAASIAIFWYMYAPMLEREMHPPSPSNHPKRSGVR